MNEIGKDSQDDDACLQEIRQKLQPGHAKEAAIVELVHALYGIRAAHANADITIDDRPPQEILDLIFQTAHLSSDEIAEGVIVPTRDDPLTFTWRYPISDRYSEASRGVGISIGTIRAYPKAFALCAEHGSFTGLAVSDILDTINYPIITVNDPSVAPNRYGYFNYANPAYIRTILDGHEPVPNQ